MAVRQYVGARYVPKFYQNSTDPSGTEWEGNRSYEALTVVSYNNDSYTSKIPVPAGIGNPASNPTYWARTGAYNAQVEQYRQEVVTAVSGVDEKLNQTTTKLEGDMQTLKSDTEQSVQQVQTQANEIQSNLTQEIQDRKDADEALKVAVRDRSTFILLTDSYGTNPETGNYVDLLKEIFPNGTYNAVGGTGFGTKVYRDDNWETMLNNVTVADANAIDAIYVLGGANDGNLLSNGRLTTDVLNTSIDSFVANATTKYPNATIYISMVGWNHGGGVLAFYEEAKACYELACNKYKNVSYIYGLDNIFHNYNFINETDNIHPTAEGSAIFAKYLGNVIKTRSTNIDVTYQIPLSDQFTATETSALGNIRGTATFNNGLVNINIIGIRDNKFWSINPTDEPVLNISADLYQAGTMKVCRTPNDLFAVMTPAVLGSSDAGGTLDCVCQIEIDGKTGSIFPIPFVRDTAKQTVVLFASVTFTVPLW